jgi:hypothetical protein
MDGTLVNSIAGPATRVSTRADWQQLSRKQKNSKEAMLKNAHADRQRLSGLAFTERGVETRILFAATIARLFERNLKRPQR